MGRSNAIDTCLQAKLVLTEELQELKEGLNLDMEQNYKKIYDLCFGYEYQDLDLIELIEDENFMTDERVSDYIQRNPDEARLRHFFGKTYTDSIYKMNGYGNLANVNKGDFEDLINSLVEKIEEEIKSEKQESFSM